MNKHVENIFFKENKWSFEQEYRLHKMWESDASNNERCIHFPIESLVEIRLGKNMSQDAKEDIKRIAKQKYPNAKIIECH